MFRTTNLFHSWRSTSNRGCPELFRAFQSAPRLVTAGNKAAGSSSSWYEQTVFRRDPLSLGMPNAVTDHTTPVGSGTVARTERISVEKRAEAALIAWMRHKTTGYDGMVIP
jgi:hypothetical protein